MNIRQYRDSDRASLIELWNTCDLIRPWNDPDKDITRKCGFQPELFLVGELDGKLIASAMAGYDGHRGSVFYLAISPQHQRAGLGKRFMQEIEQRLIAIGCPKVNIVVRKSNFDVLNFYRKLDYLPDDVESIGKRLIPDE